MSSVQGERGWVTDQAVTFCCPWLKDLLRVWVGGGRERHRRRLAGPRKGFSPLSAGHLTSRNPNTNKGLEPVARLKVSVQSSREGIGKEERRSTWGFDLVLSIHLVLRSFCPSAGNRRATASANALTIGPRRWASHAQSASYRCLILARVGEHSEVVG